MVRYPAGRRRLGGRGRLCKGTAMANTQAVSETCENCGRVIGRLETPHVHGDHVVCAECLARLTPPSRPPPAPIPAIARPTPAPSGSVPHARPDHTKWLWIGGVLLIMAGLGSFRGFPDLLAAPFLVIAGALLLPPIWSQVAKKCPSVSKQSTLVRTAACILAFAMVGLVIPKTPPQSSSSTPSPQSSSSSNLPRVETREDRIKKAFSGWDGSHRSVTKAIKDSMNDPSSYEHVETTYWDQGNYLIVRTTFRGKNAFGGVVKNWIKVKVDLDGNVLQVIEQGP